MLSIPSLMMLSIDFTCATEAVTMETLRGGGCRSLELFRNRNIRQPTEIELKLQEQQPHPPPVPAVGHPVAMADDDSDDDY